LTRYDSVGIPHDLVECTRLDPIIYVLITCNYATLHEIKDIYTIDDVLDLYEACMIQNYNRSRIIEESSKRTQ